MSVQAATNAAVFHTYLDQVQLPELRCIKPGSPALCPSGFRLSGIARCGTVVLRFDA
jgi:hypothetical protein